MTKKNIKIVVISHLSVAVTVQLGRRLLLVMIETYSLTDAKSRSEKWRAAFRLALQCWNNGSSSVVRMLKKLVDAHSSAWVVL